MPWQFPDSTPKCCRNSEDHNDEEGLRQDSCTISEISDSEIWRDRLWSRSSVREFSWRRICVVIGRDADIGSNVIITVAAAKHAAFNWRPLRLHRRLLDDQVWRTRSNKEASNTDTWAQRRARTQKGKGSGWSRKSVRQLDAMEHTRLHLFSTEKLLYFPIIGDVLSQLETNVKLAATPMQCEILCQWELTHARQGWTVKMITTMMWTPHSFKIVAHQEMYGTVREVTGQNTCSTTNEVNEITSRTMVKATTQVRAQSMERLSCRTRWATWPGKFSPGTTEEMIVVVHCRTWRALSCLQQQKGQWQWQWHTQRSPASIKWGPGLTGKSVGTMAPQKRICFTGEACSLARCANTNCYGQSVMHRDLRWTQCTRKNNTETRSHRLLLRRILNKFTESSDSEQHHRHNTKNREPGSHREKPGNQEEPRHKKDGGIPQYSSRTCCWSQILFFRTISSRTPDFFQLRTRHVLFDLFCSRSPCS